MGQAGQRRLGGVANMARLLAGFALLISAVVALSANGAQAAPNVGFSITSASNGQTTITITNNGTNAVLVQDYTIGGAFPPGDLDEAPYDCDDQPNGDTLNPGSQYRCTFVLDCGSVSGALTMEIDVIDLDDFESQVYNASVGACGGTTSTTGSTTSTTGGGGGSGGPADIKTDKVADRTEIASGDTVTFTVSVTNRSATEPVTLTELFEVSLDPETDAEVGERQDLTDTSLFPTSTCTLAAIAADTTYTCTFTQVIEGEIGAVVKDRVRATAQNSDGSDTDSSINDESVTITSGPGPNLNVALTKIATPGSVDQSGDEVTFAVTIRNTGNLSAKVDALSDVALDDADPPAPTGTPVDLLTDADTSCVDDAGATIPDRTDITIPAGDEVVCSFTAAIEGADGDSVGDRVSVTVSDPSEAVTTPVTKTADEFVDIGAGGGLALAVAKSASRTIVASSGMEVTFNIVIDNTGDAAVTITELVDIIGGGDPIDLFDPPPDIDSDCESETLDPGKDLECEFTMVVSGPSGTSVTDIVRATGEDASANEVTGEGSATVTLTNDVPNISVTKTDNGASVAEPGNLVAFDVTVTNNDDDDVRITSMRDLHDGQSTSITDTATSTCQTGVLLGASGASNSTYSCSFNRLVTGNAGSTSDDTVEVVATREVDGLPGIGRSNTESTPIIDTAPTITIDIDDNDVTAAADGDVVTYTVKVTNTGFEPVTLDRLGITADGGAVVVNDDGSVGAGNTKIEPISSTGAVDLTINVNDTYEYSVQARLVGAPGETFTLTAVAVASDDDNSTAEATDIETTPIATAGAAADIKLDKAAPGAYNVGELITYSLKIDNKGPGASTNVVVTDSLPDGLTFVSAAAEGWTCSATGKDVTCAKSSMATGEAATIALVAKIDASFTGTKITNLAKAKSDQDTNPEDPDNQGAATNTINQGPGAGGPTGGIGGVGSLPLTGAQSGAAVLYGSVLAGFGLIVSSLMNVARVQLQGVAVAVPVVRRRHGNLRLMTPSVRLVATIGAWLAAHRLKRR